MAAITLEQLETYLGEARTALHKLSIGDAVAEFRDQNGESLRYTQASRHNLEAYIQKLEDQIAVLDGTSTSAAARVGPARMFFG